MLIIDLLVVALIIGLAAWGYSRGVTIGGLALFGFGCGAVLGSRLAPLLLDGGLHSSYAPILALPGALLFGGILASVFERLGRRMRGRLARLGQADPIAGALLGVCMGVVAAWLLGAVLGQVGSLRDPLVRSTILKPLGAVLPPPGPLLVGEAAPPGVIPTFEGPAPRVARPDPRVARDPDIGAAGRKVVRISVLGCGGGALATGWIAARGVVATNAHAVVGADLMRVQIHGKREKHDATPIWFDRKNDIALLRAPGLNDVTPLPIVAAPKAGAPGAVLGFPGGRWTVAPVRLGPTSTRTPGMVGAGPGTPPRSLYGILSTTFAGRVAPGSSGGPLVDTQGRVLTTVAVQSTGDSGVGVANATVITAVKRAGPTVHTGQCEEGN